MNKLQLENDIAEMKARLASMEAELAKPKSKRFAPKIEQEYWCMGSDGKEYITLWGNDELDISRLAYGNVYETREAAGKARDKQLATVRVLNKLRELEGDWVADWDDSNQVKNSIWFYHPLKKFHTTRWQTSQFSPKEWFSTEEACQWVIDNMDADLRLMFEVE